jgi:hypothetical protein
VLALQVWLLRRAWVGLPQITTVVFVASAVLTMIDRRAIGVVLAFAYIFPALIRIGHGPYNPYFEVLWMAALLGAMAPDGFRTSWHIPAAWRPALVLWMLVILVGAPIVVLRETDYPGLMALTSAPTFAVRWVLHVALTSILGLLWFDWLFGARDLDFSFSVATPLAVSAALMASVAAYQLFGDFSFLNQTVFGNTGRASGSVFDANVCGAVAALWAGGYLLWGRDLPRWSRPLVAVGIVLAWLAVWASGSRTAFLSICIVTVFSLVAVALSARRAPRGVALPVAGVVGLVAVISLVALMFANTQVVGPVKRVWDTAPTASVASWRAFGASMWNRSGYGTAAIRMIREFPLAGVGVSAYHTLVSSMAPRRLPPDNAQNWFRHQLAELGVLGSVGWILWVALFAAFVLKPRQHADPLLWIARGILVAFTAVSMLGVPGQGIIVATTFWTFAFWFVSLAGAPPSAPLISRRAWNGIAVVVVAFAAATAYTAETRLRPPVRAQWLGDSYEYGFYWTEPAADGRPFRWAARRAAIVLEASGRWIEVSVGVNHRDVNENPVDAKVWVDQKPIIDVHLTNTEPTVQLVRLPADESRVLLETRVNRVVLPRDFGIDDGRELGLMVSWRMID